MPELQTSLWNPPFDYPRAAGDPDYDVGGA
jgi:hypothetical protein